MDAEKLQSVALFSGVSGSHLTWLAERLEEVEVPLGTVIAEAGEFAYRFFVILEGHAAVTSEGLHLAILGPGDFFGEVGLLSHGRRQANVVAITPMRLGSMLAWDFKEMMEEMPSLAAEIERTVAARHPSG